MVCAERVSKDKKASESIAGKHVLEELCGPSVHMAMQLYMQLLNKVLQRLVCSEHASVFPCTLFFCRGLVADSLQAVPAIFCSKTLRSFSGKKKLLNDVENESLFLSLIVFSRC